MSSREVEREGSNFCESRANTSQAPAPFRDVTTRQKQRPQGPIRDSPGKRDRVSPHIPPGESLPLPAPLHLGPRVPLETSPGAARVRGAAAPSHQQRLLEAAVSRDWEVPGELSLGSVSSSRRLWLSSLFPWGCSQGEASLLPLQDLAETWAQVCR